MKKVVILTLDFPPTFIGGVSAWSSDLAEALHGAGWAVTVIAKKTGDTTQHDDAKPYTIIRAKGRSWSQWQGRWMQWAARTHIQKDTLVISATWPLVHRLISTIEKRRAQLAVAFHGSEITTLGQAPKALQDVIHASSHLFPVSHFLKQELIRLGCVSAEEDRLRVLPMPLNVTPQPTHQARKNLICVARPTARKGIERAIHIAKITGRTIDLVGPTDGPPGTIAHGPLSREKTLQLMASAEAIVLTPQADERGLGEEGLGLVLLEAAARGVPGIGCRTGGVPEAIGPGLILEDPDNPDAIRLSEWLNDKSSGQRSLTWVQRHHGAERCMEVIQGSLS